VPSKESGKPTSDQRPEPLNNAERRRLRISNHLIERLDKTFAVAITGLPGTG
jgi:hypothetical protein